MNNPFIIIVIVVIGLAILISFLKIVEHLKLKKKIAREWGKAPVTSRFDQEKSLKAGWQAALKQKDETCQIDDISWHDLDMMSVFEMLNGTKSSVGAEKLYRQLRGFSLEQTELNEFQQLKTYFSEHSQERAKSQYYLAQIGKRDHNYLWHYLVNPQKNALRDSIKYYLLGLFPIMSLILLLITQMPFFMYACLGVFLINICVYLIKKQTLEQELTCMNYLVNTISLAGKLGKVPQPNQQRIIELTKKLKSINKIGLAFRTKSGSDSELFFEYFCIIFMLPLISYNLVLQKLVTAQAEAIELLEIIGAIDVAIAVLNFQQVMPYYSEPIFQEKLKIQSEGMYHPLLIEAVANDVNWQQATLVTGSNASGKSTYIKAVAINCILAQSVGVTCAKAWSMKPGHVLSSMALEDDLTVGDSYFVAEIKSVKRIIEAVSSGKTCYCFIDEILRGTNTVERIAASASIVSWLSEKESLAFIATHDIELTEILKESCCNIHFAETVTESDGIAFDFVLKLGPAKSRNALALLKVLDYPSEIVSLAEARASYFDHYRRWNDNK